MAAIIDLPVSRPGASPDDWAHFDLVLGLTADLLPVVSNPRAVIDAESALKDLGKTPSRYNAQRKAVGIHKWTEHVTTPAEIATWSRDRDLGICLQTRRVRALDVDVTDPQLAAQIHAFLAPFGMPVRSRSNASKFLMAFELPGDFHKRRVKCASGMVEFLATGQQAVVVGLHPSGVRYEWSGGLPNGFPVLSAAAFEALWTELAATFGVEAPSESQASIKGEKLASAIDTDAVAQFLLNAGRVKRTERDGRLHIACPFEEEHTGESGDTSTTYWPAHTGGYANGHFRCLHAHCEHRSDQDFLDGVGYVDAGLMSEFTALAADPDAPQPIKAEVTIDVAKPAKAERFQVLTAAQFAQGRPLTWFIKGVLPRAEMGMVYGESTAGKTFAVLDMVAHVALGLPWRGLTTHRARVVYVIAEGAAGMRYRLRATAAHFNLTLEELPIGFIADAPNLMEKADALAVAKQIVAAGGADLVVLDTFAQVMAGGNENSGEDVGKVLSHCRGISKALGGAMVLPVHHSGKDTTRGARGWSGIKAAMDVEMEVVAVDERRSLTVTKLKDGHGQGKEYGFRLESVVLGLDEDAEEITSCVVHATDAQVRKVAQLKLGEYERAVLDAVEELSGLGSGAADLEAVLHAAISRVPHEPGEVDRRRDNVKRAANNLVDKKGLLVRDGVGLRLKSQVSAG